MVWPPFLKSSQLRLYYSPSYWSRFVWLDGAVIVSGVWGWRLCLRSDHEITHGRELLSRSLSHPITSSSLRDPDSHTTLILWDIPFRFDKSIFTRISANRFSHNTLDYAPTPSAPWFVVTNHNTVSDFILASATTCMLELVMHPSWIMLRLRRPHDGNSQNHGLCSDFVGPMVFFGISTDDGSLLFHFSISANEFAWFAISATKNISRQKGFVWLQNTGNPTLRTTSFHCHFSNMAYQMTRTIPTKTTKPLFDWWFLSQHLK